MMSQPLLPYQKDKLDLQVCTIKRKGGENSLHREIFSTDKVLSRCVEWTDTKAAAWKEDHHIPEHR